MPQGSPPALDGPGCAAPRGPEAPPTAAPVVAGMVGAALVVGVVVFGVLVAGGSTPLRLDAWAFSVTRGHRHGPWVHVTALGYPLALVVGAVGFAVLAGRRARALVLPCGAGPFVAAGFAELVLKPAVGRTFEGASTYPSGTVVVVAALCAAAVVALPGWPRRIAVVVGAVVTALTVVAVVTLRWHYATDALAGAALGLGVVLLLWWPAAALGRSGSWTRRPGG